ncbi:hypothetical protein A9Q84_00030 [Halobacteriovorax marinus]|uniref:AAA domain-containing protein n=1 Tax=Halobacteriovorax marinus TaxID=97084 RepID=A0A1Y5FH24_9BACT|nr:hypothetical protein A9Q84_00030 [Halobacteriovorax marinus]
MEDFLNPISGATHTKRQISKIFNIDEKIVGKFFKDNDANFLHTYKDVRAFGKSLKEEQDKKVMLFTFNKGGVGKTTHTFNFSQNLALRGKRVLVWDFDRQANATEYFMSKEGRLSVADYFKNEDGLKLKDLVVDIDDSLSVVPSGEKMANLNLYLTERFHFSNGSFSENADLSKLDQFINEFKELSKDFDAVLIDSPPSFGLLHFLLFIVSDVVFNVTGVTSNDFEAIDDSVSLYVQAKEWNPKLDMKFLINCRDTVRNMDIHLEDVQELRAKIKSYGFSAFENIIPTSDIFFYSTRDGIPFWLVDINNYDEKFRNEVVQEITEILSTYSEVYSYTKKELKTKQAKRAELTGAF